MQDQNDKLTTLLKQWPEIEPRPAFDQDVLRRIRLARAESAHTGLFDRLAARLTSAWGVATAVAAAVAVGFVLANATPAPKAAVAQTANNVSEWLADDSVSGNYVAMLSGGGR